MKKSAMVPLVLPLLLALGAPLGADEKAASEEQALIELLTEARSRYIQKDHKGSIELFTRYMERLPEEEESGIDGRRMRARYSIAVNRVALGEHDEALADLERAVDHGLWSTAFLENDPTLEPLRSRPRFRELVEKADRGVAGMAFGLRNLEGKKLEKKDFEGKVLIIDVWGTWCPPCRMEVPHFVELQEKYRGEGLRIIGVTYENRPPSEAVRQHVVRQAGQLKINYPCVLAPSDLVAASGVDSFPTTFFVDRNGVVRERLVGYHNLADLERRVVKLLREKKKEPAKRAADEGEAGES